MNRYGYPRPQMVREQWQSLNGEWEFEFDDAQQFSLPADPIPWSRRIAVPFTPKTEASGIGDTGFHPACRYRRRNTKQTRGARTLLHFGAVDYQATVWGNN